MWIFEVVKSKCFFFRTMPFLKYFLCGSAHCISPETVDWCSFTVISHSLGVWNVLCKDIECMNVIQYPSFTVLRKLLLSRLSADDDLSWRIALMRCKFIKWEDDTPLFHSVCLPSRFRYCTNRCGKCCAFCLLRPILCGCANEFTGDFLNVCTSTKKMSA